MAPPNGVPIKRIQLYYCDSSIKLVVVNVIQQKIKKEKTLKTETISMEVELMEFLQTNPFYSLDFRLHLYLDS